VIRKCSGSIATVVVHCKLDARLLSLFTVTGLLSLGFHRWFTVAGYYRSAPFARFLSLGSLHWVTLPGFTHAGFPSLGSRRWDIVARLRLSAL